MIEIKLKIKEESWSSYNSKGIFFDSQGIYMRYKNRGNYIHIDKEEKYDAMKKGTSVDVFCSKDFTSPYSHLYIGSFIKED